MLSARPFYPGSVSKVYNPPTSGVVSTSYFHDAGY
jgi:hypothetical protein